MIPGASEQGAVAQLGERRLCKAEARGSNPLISTRRLVAADKPEKEQGAIGYGRVSGN